MDDIIKIINDKIRDLNETMDDKIDLSNGSESILFGSGSPLESVDFVSLISDIEQAIEDEFDKTITIADSRAMSQKQSPFRTVGALAEYIQLCLREENNG